MKKYQNTMAAAMIAAAHNAIERGVNTRRVGAIALTAEASGMHTRNPIGTHVKYPKRRLAQAPVKSTGVPFDMTAA